MRRFIAILVGFAVVASSQAPALHIHAYIDHDHPEHHHGLAAHEHATVSHPVDDEVHLESCDPGRHAVSLVLGCPALPKVDSIEAHCAGPSVIERLICLRTTSTVTDIRVHGPPPRTQAPPRAPPLLFPA